jgi:hypothetical protein
MLIIAALRKLRQKDFQLYANLGHIARLSQNKNKKPNNNKQNKYFSFISD